MARRRRSKRSSHTNVMKRRLGLLGWKNSRPFFNWSQTLVTRTMGSGHNPGTTMGATFILPVNNWNDPLGSLSTLVAGTGSLINARRPVRHADALAAGYQRCQVLSWHADIKVNWIASAGGTSDFIVAYTFGQDNTTEVVLTVGDAGRVEVLEFLTNPRWTIKRFDANNSGTFRPTSTRGISINVPDVFAYCQKMAEGQLNVEANNSTVGHVMASVASTTNGPTVQLFCTVAIFTESGLAMAIDSVNVTVAITQRVKVMRDFIGTEDMDDGETGIHA